MSEKAAEPPEVRPMVRILRQTPVGKLVKMYEGVSYEVGCVVVGDQRLGIVVRIVTNRESGTHSTRWLDMARVAEALSAFGAESFYANDLNYLFKVSQRSAKANANPPGFLVSAMRLEGVLKEDLNGKPTIRKVFPSRVVSGALERWTSSAMRQAAKAMGKLEAFERVYPSSMHLLQRAREVAAELNGRRPGDRRTPR